MKKPFLSAMLVLLAGCQSPDKICDCIAAGNKLNEKSAEVLKTNTVADPEQLKQLRAEKEKACKEFEFMDGAEMKKRMETCR